MKTVIMPGRHKGETIPDLEWEIRADEFMFPPPERERKPGEVYLTREYSEEEMAKRRYYVSVDAAYLYGQEEDIGPAPHFIARVSVLLELVGGVLTTPRLKEWWEYQVKASITDLESFRRYRDATKHEIELFLDAVARKYPNGVPM